MLLGLARDGVAFVFQYIRSNRVRTGLSLAGVSIGIFTIIAIFVVIDSLKTSINENFSQLGENAIMVDRWAWGLGGEEYRWWDYVRNPYPNRKDFLAIKAQSREVAEVAMFMNTGGTVRLGSVHRNPQGILGVTEGAENFMALEIGKGRGFSQLDMSHGLPVCILGYDLAKELCPVGSAVGKVVRIKNRPTTVIGVLKEQSDVVNFGGNNNERVIIPFEYIRTMVNSRRAYAQIAVHGKSGTSDAALKDDLRRVLRGARRLKPSQSDNFALNSMKGLRDALDGFIAILNLAGFIIGGLSVLVGGFGIANIMFVSVKERTKIIGIQKALGARRSFILGQFLLESTLLSILGGGVGLLLLEILILATMQSSEFQLHMTLGHVLMGIGASAIIGIVSGFIPARNASLLNPVAAIDKTI